VIDHFTGRPLVGVNLRKRRVLLSPLIKQSSDLPSWVIAGQQRSTCCSVAAKPLHDGANRRRETIDIARRRQHTHILGPHQHAAPSANDEPFDVSELHREHALRFTETRLAVRRKDLRNWSVATNNDCIGIDITKTSALREQRSNGRFPGSHEPGQNDISQRDLGTHGQNRSGRLDDPRRSATT
jgi:hypothetical protein